MQRRLFTFIPLRRRINLQTLRDDLIAGLSGAVTVLPQGGSVTSNSQMLADSWHGIAAIKRGHAFEPII